MKKIYVSPSSQTENMYATGATNEAEQCRKIALKLVDALKRCGFDAKTNVSDNADIYDRVKESNAWCADLHIPIHTNAFNGKIKGTRMFVDSVNSASYKICQEISKTLNPITPGESDSIASYPDLYEIKTTNMPCAYIEVAFHDNIEEARWIIANTDKIAEEICEGICNYYNVKYVKSAPKVLYRVRKSWSNIASQVGAYYSLDNAKRECDRYGSVYHVFDESGAVVYPIISDYRVKVMTDSLNIRSGPSINYSVAGCIKDWGVYTIVDEKNGFGKLKSGAGWISLQYVIKI